MVDSLAFGFQLFRFYLRIGVIMAEQFNWSGYLHLAEELGKRSDEASLRSALSRAYYYVYHLALERAEANDFRPISGGTHTQLWQFFDGSPEPACKKLAILARRLKDKRVRADYNKNFNRIAEEVPEILEDARNFAAQLDRVDARHPNQRSMRR